MKKVLIPTLFAASVTPLSCLVSLTSCGRTDPNVIEIYNKALEYFVGADYKGGICAIAHPTGSKEGNLDAIRDYLKQEITACGIATIHQDDFGNLWYDIPATQGCSSWKKLCLQAHMDMVWETEESYTGPDHPVPVKDHDGQREIIHTEGFKTSLGADNGAGLAIMLAITANKNIAHGPIRCIITADEETGMNGAAVIGKVEGQPTINVVDHNQGFDYMLNLDAETEGDVFVSCAGGYSAQYKLEYSYTDGADNNSMEPIDDQTLYKIRIEGGMGGHSGMNMIHNPINSVMTATTYLQEISLLPTLDNLKLVFIDSHEEVGNVIPKEADVIFGLPKISPEEEATRKQVLDNYFTHYLADVKNAHKEEKNLNGWIDTLTQQEQQQYTYCLTRHNSIALIQLIGSLKFGAQEVRVLPDGTKELISSSNVCPVNLLLDNSEPQFNFMIFDRSENEEYLKYQYIEYTAAKVSLCSTYSEGKVPYSIIPKSQYPAYVYNPNDKIRQQVFNSYKKLNIIPKEQRTHGGIECAWWYRYNNDIQQASIGPTILNCHNPQETLYLDTYKHLVQIVLDMISQMGSM